MAMRSVPIPRSTSPELPLKYVGGDPSVDLVNTVDWLHDGLDHDRIPDYGRLTEWAQGDGVIAPATGERLRRTATAHQRQAASAGTAIAYPRRLAHSLLTDYVITTLLYTDH